MVRLKIGTNRLVIICKNFVYKLPLGLRGVRANWDEFKNAFGKDYVAKTERKWYGLRQEALTDLVTLPYKYDGEIKEEWKPLWGHMVHNRFQVGKSKSGTWKFYDYEEVKFYEKDCK